MIEEAFWSMSMTFVSRLQSFDNGAVDLCTSSEKKMHLENEDTLTKKFRSLLISYFTHINLANISKI